MYLLPLNKHHIIEQLYNIIIYNTYPHDPPFSGGTQAGYRSTMPSTYNLHRATTLATQVLFIVLAVEMSFEISFDLSCC